MWTEKEQYRNFENSRFVWEAFDKPPTVDTGEKNKDKAKNPEDKKKATEDKSDIIAENRKNALEKIGDMQKKYEKHPQYKDAAVQLAAALKTHATERFDKISHQYNVQRDSDGMPFAETTVAKDLETQAKKLYTEINDRTEKAETYLKYETRQDTMAKARAEAEAKPKEAEEVRREQKMAIIVDYLDQAEDTKGMDPQMKKMLARFIVEEGNLVELEFGDVNSEVYQGRLDHYFQDVDRFNEYIGGQLKGKLEKVVQRFLAEAPNPDAKKEEIKLIKSWITEDKDSPLFKQFGNKEYATQAATVMAKRFDIRFEDEAKTKVSYAVDLMARPNVVVYNPESFKKLVTTELRTEPAFEPQAIGRYGERVDEGTAWLVKMRGEVAGDINADNWDEWTGHEAASSLMRRTDAIRTRAEEIEGDRNAEAAKGRVEAKRKVEAKKYYDAVEAADLSGAVKKATSPEGGYKLVSREKDSQPEREPFVGSVLLESTAEGTQVIITLNAEGKIRLHIATSDSADKRYSVDYSFTKPEDFKKAVAEGNGLATMARKAKANVERNSSAILDINGTIEGAKQKLPQGLAIKFEGATLYSEMAQDSYRVPEPKLMIGEHQVGSLTFSADKKTVTIHIEGQPDSAPIAVAKLGETLGTKANVGKMQEVAERGKKNKDEIVVRVAEDLPKLTDVTPDKGLTVISEKELKGDFSKPDEKITIATIYRSDKSPVATLYIKVGEPAKPKEKTKPREYVLKVNSEDISCANIDAVNKYLADNQVALAALPPEEPKREQVKQDREAARDNLAKMPRLWGEKMAGISPDDPRFMNALTVFVNKDLTPERATELGKPEAIDIFQLTPKEKSALQREFAKAYGSLEAVDENEVKLISAMKVTVEGKPESNFSQVFGDQLVRILSRSHEFKAGENGAVMVKEGDTFAPVTAEGMAKYVPEAMRDSYIKILNGKATDADRTAFQEKAGDEEKAQKAMTEIDKIMRDPQRAKAFSEMGLGELIATFAQLYALFQEAMKTGDYKSLEDGLADIQRGGGMERMKAAKEAYTQEVAKIDDTGTLLSLYTEPYGAEAKKRFGEGDKTAPYRIQLRSVIQERLAKELNVDISKMESKSPKEATITASKGGRNYRIYLDRSTSTTYATMEEIKMDPDGKEIIEPVGAPKREVRGLTTGEKNLQTVLFGSAAEEKPTGSETPEFTADKPGEKTGKPLEQASDAEKTAARQKFAEGQAASDKKDYPTALKRFQEANAIIESPVTHLKIARCLVELHRNDEAEKEAQSFLAAPGVKTNKQTAEAQAVITKVKSERSA